MALLQCLVSTSGLARRLLTNNKFTDIVFCQSRLTCVLISTEQRRHYSFVKKVRFDDLWGSVQEVSNPGRKRGRLKSVFKRVNIHKHQKIGQGIKGQSFPGLNVPILSKTSKRAESYESDALKKDFDAIHNTQIRRRTRATSKYPNPLLRGYNSSFPVGVSLGPPDPIGENDFSAFDSRLLELRKTTNITSDKGKVFSFRALVAVGNGNGIAGYAVARANSSRLAQMKARNKAILQLQFIERYSGHTLVHHTHAQVHHTKVFAKRVCEGHAIVAHRVVKDLCMLMGLKDIYVKVEGNTTNYIALTMAFFNAVTRQESHQKLANRLNMHIVELRKERQDYPVVIASPESGLLQKNYINDEREVYNTNTMYTRGKLHWSPNRIPPEWERKKFKSLKRRITRNLQKVGQHEAQMVRRLNGLEPSVEEYKIRHYKPGKEEQT